MSNKRGEQNSSRIKAPKSIKEIKEDMFVPAL